MGFDYRFGNYPLENYNKKLAIDESLLTFRGHKVLATLIRCHFSPISSTDKRYIYTGSADGKVYIYDSYTGKKAAVLEPEYEEQEMNDIVCRDVSWHPYLPIIAATSFDESIYQFNYC